MQFRFDANQEFQQRAVASVADVFQGMPRASSQSVIQMMGAAIPLQTEQAAIDPARLLDNVRRVQRANRLPEDAELKTITETADVGGAKQAVTFPNLSVEMETGTGKTYVYLRTALELNRRHGLRKFVIVVPSVAVREGVLKTFQVTRDHFADLFDNEPYRFEVYDSKNLTRLRGFAEDDAVRFLVMTIDSFNKEQNVIRSRTDRLQGRVGLHLLQAVRPSAAGRSNASRRAGGVSSAIHSAYSAGVRRAGIRACSGATVGFAAVVTRQQLNTRSSPSPHCSHSPANASSRPAAGRNRCGTFCLPTACHS